MTDITELTQRDKFEAWWERTQHNGNPPRFGWEYWREGEGYKVDDDDSELDGMWSAWKAAGDELVEALASEKRICATWRKTATAVSEKLEKAHQCITELKSGKVGNALLERENHHVEVVGKLTERIAELEEAEQKLCAANITLDARAELAERQLAEMESRTVKLPDDEDGQAYGFGKWSNGKLPATAGTMTIAYCEDAWRAAFEVFASAAGIKVEAE